MCSRAIERLLMEARRRFYTVLTLADAIGREPATVRKHIREGWFDIESILSVGRYIAAADLERANRRYTEGREE